MRTLCCAVCAMKGSGLGRCSMQLAGGYLIHKLYPLTFSVATRPLSAFAWRGLVVKQCAIPIITVCISLIIPNAELCVPYRSHEYCVNIILILDSPLSSYSMLAWSVAIHVVYPYAIIFMLTACMYIQYCDLIHTCCLI